MKTAKPRERTPAQTLAFLCKGFARMQRELEAYRARLAFLEERAVLADRSDVRQRKSFRGK